MYSFDDFVDGEIFVAVFSEDELHKFYNECKTRSLQWGVDGPADHYIEEDIETIREDEEIVFYFFPQWLSCGWSRWDRRNERKLRGKELPTISSKDLTYNKLSYKINLKRA